MTDNFFLFFFFFFNKTSKNAIGIPGIIFFRKKILQNMQVGQKKKYHTFKNVSKNLSFRGK